LKTLIITLGLPASGKSTYAKQLVHDEHYKRINRDLLREMTDAGQSSSSKEKDIRALELLHADYFFARGWNIVVDDCNLSPSAQTMWQECAKKNNAKLEIKDFTHVTVDECIARDKKRQNYVGEKVIRDMYNRYLAKPIVPPAPVEGAPQAIIVDLDGTLALFGDANPYDRDFSEDIVNSVVAGLVFSEISQGTTILFTSGRNDKFREATYTWLRAAGFCFEAHDLFMRKDGDFRKDFIVKEEMYHEQIEGKYNVKYALDDRAQVVRLWRSLGLTCLQVAEGDF